MSRGLVGVLLALTVWAYVPALTGPFVYEDYGSVPWASGETGRIHWPGWQWLTPGRRVTMWTLQTNYDLGGERTLGYHLGNLAIHLLNGGLLWLIARRLLATDGAALVALAVFWLHPIQVEAVAYISGRTDLLLTTGALLGLWAIVTPVRLGWRLLALAGSVGLALGAKEQGIVILALLPWSAWLLAEVVVPWAVVAVAGWLLLLAAIPLVWRITHDPYVTLSAYGVLGYAAHQAAAAWRLLALVVWPVGFTVDHDFDLVGPALAALALGALGALALAAWRVRRPAPLVTWAVGWALLAIGPRFILRMPELLNEHQFLTVMVAVALAGGWLAGALAHVLRGVSWSVARSSSSWLASSSGRS